MGIVVILIAQEAKLKAVKKEYSVETGSTLEQVITALGEPAKRVQKKEKLICNWKGVLLDGKKQSLKIVFADDNVKSIT